MDSPAVRITRVADADAAAHAARLLAAQLDDHAIPYDAARLRATVDGAVADPTRARVLLAWLDDAGAPAGVAYLSFTWTLEHGGRSSWLEELYVRPAHREHGVGGALLDAAVQQARAAGCAAVDLEVETDHARAARLYLRRGFRPHTRSRFVLRLAPADGASGGDGDGDGAAAGAPGSQSA